MSNPLVDLCVQNPVAFRELANFVVNAPDITGPVPDSLLAHSYILPEFLQKYTLTPLAYLNGVTTRNQRSVMLNFFGFETTSTGGLNFGSEFSFALQQLLTSLTKRGEWSVGDIEGAVDGSKTGMLRNLITIYNNLCKIRPDDYLVLNPDMIKKIGGPKRVVFLMMTYSTSIELMRADILSISSEAPQAEPHNNNNNNNRANANNNFQRLGPVRRAISPDHLRELGDHQFKDIPQPELGPPEVQIESAAVLFKRDCVFCMKDLVAEKNIPRYRKCTHIYAFHWECYMSYVNQWGKTKKGKSKEKPGCPIYGCGWTYTYDMLDAITCEENIFQPAETRDAQFEPPGPKDVMFIEDD